MYFYSLETPSVRLHEPPLHYWHGVEVLQVRTLQANEEQALQHLNTQAVPPVSLGTLYGTEAPLDCCCGQRQDQDELHNEKEVGEVTPSLIIQEKVLPSIPL